MKIILPVILVAFVSSWSQPAMAYIDPGSGSAIMSALIGLFVAIGLAIKTYWYKLKSLFIAKKLDSEIEKEPDSEQKLDQ